MASGLRERQKAERVDRILTSARDLLREEGELASTERIAERAEVSPATIYNLVGPRERLWQALAKWLNDELELGLADVAGRSGLVRARAVVRLCVDLLVADPAVTRCLVQGWEDSGVVLAPGPATHLRAALDQAVDEGDLRPDVATGPLAAVIASACNGGLHEWAAGLIDDTRYRKLAEHSLDVVIAAAAADGKRAELVRPLRRRRAA